MNSAHPGGTGPSPPKIYRKELVDIVAAQLQLPAEQVDAVAGALFERITQEMLRGVAVTIYGFGTFTCEQVKPRGVDATSWSPGRRRPVFRPGDSMDSRFK